MERIDENTIILIQDLGISKTHPIIFFRNRENVVICSIASEDGTSIHDYSIIIPRSQITNWDSNNKRYFLESICNTQVYLFSSPGHELAIKNGITMDLIENSKKYISE